MNRTKVFLLGRIIKIIMVFELIFMLTACPPPYNSTLVKHQEKLNMWKGKDVGTIIGTYGRPDRTEVVEDYHVIYYSLVKKLPFGADRKCEITFSKEKDGDKIIATGVTSSSGDTYVNIDPCHDLIKVP